MDSAADRRRSPVWKLQAVVRNDRGDQRSDDRERRHSASANSAGAGTRVRALRFSQASAFACAVWKVRTSAQAHWSTKAKSVRLLDFVRQLVFVVGRARKIFREKFAGVVDAPDETLGEFAAAEMGFHFSGDNSPERVPTFFVNT